MFGDKYLTELCVARELIDLHLRSVQISEMSNQAARVFEAFVFNARWIFGIERRIQGDRGNY